MFDFCFFFVGTSLVCLSATLIESVLTFDLPLPLTYLTQKIQEKVVHTVQKHRTTRCDCPAVVANLVGRQEYLPIIL